MALAREYLRYTTLAIRLPAEHACWQLILLTVCWAISIGYDTVIYLPLLTLSTYPIPAVVEVYQRGVQSPFPIYGIWRDTKKH